MDRWAIRGMPRRARCAAGAARVTPDEVRFRSHSSGAPSPAAVLRSPGQAQGYASVARLDARSDRRSRRATLLAESSTKSRRRLLRGRLLGGLALLAGLAAGQQAERESLYIPPLEEDAGLQTLAERARAQIAAAGEYRAFHAFRFTDRLPESGIRFVHRIVDDVGKHFKPVHYDHGNSISIADVDGDGRHDIYFTTQLGSNELWRNLGGGRFEDATGGAGIGMRDRISVVGTFGDLDNDGDPDLYVTTVRQGNVLFENDGTGRFTDVTAKAGVGYVGHSSAALVFDYNRDGLLDIYLVNVGRYTLDGRAKSGAYIGMVDAFRRHVNPEDSEQSILYENLGGLRFRDVSAERGLADRSWTGDGSVADLNGDLWPDLYLVNMQGDDHYYESAAGRSFVDKTRERFPKTPWGTMGIRFFDANNDGLLDLFLTDMHSDMPYLQSPAEEKGKTKVDPDEPGLQGGRDNIFGNAFYRNLGGGRFEEVSDALGLENYWPWGVSSGDLNADGWEDLFVASSMSYPYRYGVNSVYVNEGGERFREGEFVLGVEPRRGGRARTPWFDLDCSGEDEGHRLCEGRSGRYTVMASLGTRSAVIFDLDGDGDLDIVTTEFNAEPQVLVSDLAERRKIAWLEVELRGTASNRDGLGAMVKVFAGPDVYTRLHDGKSGYLSQSSMPLYFGLGEWPKPSVDRVEVLWPSGVRQTVTEGLAVNTRIRIVEEGVPPGSSP